MDVAGKSGNFRSFTGAVGQAGLTETFSGQGEYTVFAPTDEAFTSVSDQTGKLSNDELGHVLKYHVIPARISAAQLTSAIKANRGYYRLQTVSGESLIATMKGDKVMLTDGNGGVVTVTATDTDSSNGTIHTVDGVLMPRSK